jgi:hypothetical protein
LAIDNARVLMRTLLLGLTLSSAAWGQSAKPNLAETPRELPRRLPYEEGQRVPDGYRLRTGTNKPLVIAGIAVGGAGYAFGVLGALDNDFEDNTGFLLIPVAGPWLTLAAGPDPSEPCPEQEGEVCPTGDISFRVPALVLDGILQALGTTFLVTGLTTTRLYLQRADVAVSVVPTSFAGRGYGLGAVGRF